jgi:ADP-heptose:LPS heptosyltransferase
VVDLGFLGDSVHLIPALVEIKRHYPQAALHTISTKVGAELLRLSASVDKAWAFPLGTPSPPWWWHWDIIRALRREHYDVALNFGGADRTNFITALTGARWRLGHAAGRRHFWNRALIKDWVTRRDSNQPVFEQRRQVLAEAGFSLEPARWDCRLPSEAARRAEAVGRAGAIHFSINASTVLKEWPLRHWIQLGEMLLAHSPEMQIVATGSASAREQGRLQALAAAIQNSRLRLAPPDLTVAELAWLLRRCRLHIGADSGVLHLAMALNVPTFALFRDYPGGVEWLPRGPRHRHGLVRCDCIRQRRPACIEPSEARCLAQLSPGAVMEELMPLLAGFD